MNDELPPGEEPPRGPGEEFYSEQFDRLTEIAAREHSLDRDAAEQLAHDILLGFMSRAGRVPNPTQWLDASMRWAGKHLRRTAGER